MFHKLMFNFTWWVNREDEGGRNLFQGGFLGLDNIGLFDLSKPLPSAAGSTSPTAPPGWRRSALNMMRIALDALLTIAVFEDLATKFFEHFVDIARGDARDRQPGRTVFGTSRRDFDHHLVPIYGQPDQMLRVRSIVGLVPLLAVQVILRGFRCPRFPHFTERLDWFVRPSPRSRCDLYRYWREPNQRGYRLLSLMRRYRMNCVLLVGCWMRRSSCRISVSDPFRK